MSSTSAPSGTTHTPQASGWKSQSLTDTIRQIEHQIEIHGNGPHTPKQKEDIGKLNLLLQKARTEHQKALLGRKAPDIGQPPMSTTYTAVPTTAPPMAMVPVTATTLSASNETKALDKRRLQELVQEVDPLEQLDDDVEEVLLQVADDFIDNVVNAACQIAKHRKSNTLEVKDVQLYLERNWNMYIPGFGTDELRPYKRAAPTEAHKQRMALIRKTLKKF